MPRRCTVCDHPKRAEIDAALVDQAEPYREIALSHGLGIMSIYRHTEHIPTLIADAPSAIRIAAAETLLEKVQNLEATAAEVIDEARDALAAAKNPPTDPLNPGSTDLRLKAIRELTGGIRSAVSVLELLGRVSGELQAQQTTVNVLIQSAEGRAFLEAVYRAVKGCDGCSRRVREEVAAMALPKRLAG